MARRKLRTALTAIAIVLGVALITGTYVLTDSIKGAFGGIFTSVYRGTDATVTGKSAFNLEQQRHDDGAALRPVAPAGDPRPAGRRRCGRRRRRQRASHPQRQGRRTSAARRTSASASTRRGPSSTRSRSSTGSGRGEPGRDRPGDGAQEGPEASARRSACRRAGRRSSMTISGFVHFGGAASLGGATLSGFDLPTGAAALPARRASSTRSARRRSPA